jgi:hypothetical protein
MAQSRFDPAIFHAQAALDDVNHACAGRVKASVEKLHNLASFGCVDKADFPLKLIGIVVRPSMSDENFAIRRAVLKHRNEGVFKFASVAQTRNQNGEPWHRVLPWHGRNPISRRLSP